MTIFITHGNLLTTFRRLLVAKIHETQLILFEGNCCQSEMSTIEVVTTKVVATTILSFGFKLSAMTVTF